MYIYTYIHTHILGIHIYIHIYIYITPPHVTSCDHLPRNAWNWEHPLYQNTEWVGMKQ